MQSNGASHLEMFNSPFLLTRSLYQNESNNWPNHSDTINNGNLNSDQPNLVANNASEITNEVYTRGLSRPSELSYISNDSSNETPITNTIAQPSKRQASLDVSINERFLAIYNLMHKQILRYSPIRHSRMRLEDILTQNLAIKKFKYSRHNINRMNCTYATSTSFENDENIVPKNLLQQQANHYIYPYQDPYRITHLDADCSYIKLYTKSTSRKISKDPFKILDAPNLIDDFYLNLVDWSSTDLLAVGLGSTVYLLSACTSKISKLFDVLEQSERHCSDAISCVNWDSHGSFLAVGLKSGNVEIWDAVKSKKLRTFEGHRFRVGSIAWNGRTLSSGSKDGKIFNHDIRQSTHSISIWDKHLQEVCGLRYSPNEKQLASGGNDNVINIWQQGYDVPVLQITEHQAAVKALSWSPHQNGLLASGGGTADRTIRFWNTLSNQALNKIDTDSQVCNIAWSKTANELVSTHGYSLNQIIVWNYPPMTKIATLTGHTCRVLYLAESPHGQNIVTGAGDETLRFWNIFPPKQPIKSSGKQEMRFQTPTMIR